MHWLNAGALSLMLMMLVGTFHLGAILTGEVGTVARHAANLVVVEPSFEQVKLPNYEDLDSGSSKATLNKEGDFAVPGNQPPSVNPSQKHCEEVGGTYSDSEGNCFGLGGRYFW